MNSFVNGVSNGVKWVGRQVAGAWNCVKRNTSAAIVAVSVGAATAVGSLQAQATLPDTGVDVSEYVSAAITQMGTIMGTVIAGFCAFLVIRKGMSAARRAI